MTYQLTRRDLLTYTAAAVATACAPATAPVRGEIASLVEADPFARVETRVGGRVGVFAVDTGSAGHLGRRQDERFAMCSTFKWALAAAVLLRVDRGQLALDERIAYGPADLLDHAPAAREHLAEGAMTVDALARAAVTQSDNTAANLLLAKVGGPLGLTQFCRELGDTVTRLDRNEPALNTNVRGDPRDTTTPRAMAGLLRTVLCGDALSRGSRDRLVAWLRACETGLERLRAGVPVGWVVGDKTGTGLEGAVNDVAILYPPGRAPIVVTAYMSDGTSPPSALNTAHADVARIVARQLG